IARFPRFKSSCPPIQPSRHSPVTLSTPSPGQSFGRPSVFFLRQTTRPKFTMSETVEPPNTILQKTADGDNEMHSECVGHIDQPHTPPPEEQSVGDQVDLAAKLSSYFRTNADARFEAELAITELQAELSSTTSHITTSQHRLRGLKKALSEVK